MFNKFKKKIAKILFIFLFFKKKREKVQKKNNDRNNILGRIENKNS